MLVALIALAFVVVGIVVIVTRQAPWYAGAVLIAVGVLIFAVFNGNFDDEDAALMAMAIPIRFTRRRTPDTLVSHTRKEQS